MAVPPTCAFNVPIPNPPTTLSACSVPLGGSNSTILDTCCNAHINPILKYGAPDSSECYQYCTTDSVHAVMECLSQPENLGAFDAENPKWSCYNVGDVRKEEAVDDGYGYGSGVGRVRLSKAAVVVGILGLVGVVMRC
jgi:hypothetical protein